MTKEIQELEKGCGKEVCAVETKIDGKPNDEPNIQVCGEYCPYHKEIHYCKDCEIKLQFHKSYQEKIKKLKEEIVKHNKSLSLFENYEDERIPTRNLFPIIDKIMVGEE